MKVTVVTPLLPIEHVLTVTVLPPAVSEHVLVGVKPWKVTEERALWKLIVLLVEELVEENEVHG